MNTAQTIVTEEGKANCSSETTHPPFPFLLERILVPVDFSELSRKALRYAIPLARSTGARLILLNVVSSERHREGPGSIASPQFEAGKWRMLDERERQLVDLCRREIGRDPKSEAIIQTGRPSQEIIKAAETWNVDMIIMATHGSTGLSRMLKSSITQLVVAAAPCPILIVRQHGHDLIPV